MHVFVGHNSAAENKGPFLQSHLTSSLNDSSLEEKLLPGKPYNLKHLRRLRQKDFQFEVGREPISGGKKDRERKPRIDNIHTL